jgi:hypothetical protein
MSGDGKRGVGHGPQATAPILDSAIWSGRALQQAFAELVSGLASMFKSLRIAVRNNRGYQRVSKLQRGLSGQANHLTGWARRSRVWTSLRALGAHHQLSKAPFRSCQRIRRQQGPRSARRSARPTGKSQSARHYYWGSKATQYGGCPIADSAGCRVRAPIDQEECTAATKSDVNFRFCRGQET